MGKWEEPSRRCPHVHKFQAVNKVSLRDHLLSCLEESFSEASGGVQRSWTEWTENMVES